MRSLGLKSKSYLTMVAFLQKERAFIPFLGHESGWFGAL